MNDTFNRIRYVGRRSFNERVWRFDVAQNLVGYARFHVYSNFTSTSKQMYVHVCVCVNVCVCMYVCVCVCVHMH